MQEEKKEKCSRLRAIHKKSQLQWAQIAERLSLSQSMIYQVLAGKREMSEQSLHRLESLEQSYLEPKTKYAFTTSGSREWEPSLQTDAELAATISETVANFFTAPPLLHTATLAAARKYWQEFETRAMRRITERQK